MRCGFGNNIGIATFLTHHKCWSSKATVMWKQPQLIFRSVPCPLKFSCRDVWRGALTKSVIRPMAAWRPRCVIVGASRRSDRFKSLAHISKRDGLITSFAICQHCQNRVVANRISKSASELLSTISSLRYDTRPRLALEGPTACYQTCSYRTISNRGRFRQ